MAEDKKEPPVIAVEEEDKSPELLAAERRARMRAAVNRGYVSGTEKRKIKGFAHLEFLMRAGEDITL